MKINIKCFDTTFTFESEDLSACWYDFDHAESIVDGRSLKLNADREVYAVYTDSEGIEHYGTVGDNENEFLADNYPCEEGTEYIFYENPRTKDYYV